MYEIHVRQYSYCELEEQHEQPNWHVYQVETEEEMEKEYDRLFYLQECCDTCVATDFYIIDLATGECV